VPPRVPLLDLPVREGVARVAREYLGDAESALGRLRNARDIEALHDFRVAVRRLRSLLRAYRRWIGRAGGKKVRRRLRDLGQATNAGRDAEVQVAWLEAQRAALARRERSGLNWLLRRLRAVKRDSYRAARGRGCSARSCYCAIAWGRPVTRIPASGPRSARCCASWSGIWT
jgi:hypothetical protein